MGKTLKQIKSDKVRKEVGCMYECVNNGFVLELVWQLLGFPYSFQLLRAHVNLNKDVFLSFLSATLFLVAIMVCLAS